MPLPSDEQIMMRDMARGWADRNAPVAAFRAMRNSDNQYGFEAETFAALAELGLTGTLVTQDHGGSDVGHVSMGLVLQELGRTLVAAPLIGSAVGVVGALQLGGSEAQKNQWLPKIADGSAIGALALDEQDRFQPEYIALKAIKSGSGYVLDGTKLMVHEGLAADVFVVAARTSGSVRDSNGVSLFLVPADTKGIARKRRHVLDSRGYADVHLDKVQLGADALIGKVDQGRGLLDQVIDRVTAVVAAEQLGLALQAFDTTLDYMKTRVQFGQVIGTFQALQHRAAKLFTDIQLARPTIDAALFALDEGAVDAPAMVSLAKATANDLVNTMTREMIQLHGGIGMTDAHDAGFYIKRARALEAAFGSSAYHRERYARLNGI